MMPEQLKKIIVSLPVEIPVECFDRQGNNYFFQLLDRKSTRLNSSHSQISYAVFCFNKKRSDHRHAALENIQKLRQFVKAGTTEEFPHPGDSGIAGNLRRILIDGRFVMHAAEFAHFESPAILADVKLPEEDGTRRIDFDQCRQKQKQR